jgi:hypothetical protein
MATKFPLGYRLMDSVHEEFEIAVAVAVAASSLEVELSQYEGKVWMEINNRLNTDL